MRQKYYQIIGSWYGQNLGEMYSNIEIKFSFILYYISFYLYYRTFPSIQEHSRIPKYNFQIQEHLGTPMNPAHNS